MTDGYQHMTGPLGGGYQQVAGALRTPSPTRVKGDRLYYGKKSSTKRGRSKGKKKRGR